MKKTSFLLTLFLLLATKQSFSEYLVHVPLEIDHGGHLPNNSIIIGNKENDIPTLPSNPIEPEKAVCTYTGNTHFLVIDFKWNSGSFYYPYQDRVVWDGQTITQPYRSNDSIPSYQVGGYEYYVLGEAKQVNDYSSSGSGVWRYYEICRKKIN